MKKENKEARKKRGASAWIAVCFIAAVLTVGTYTWKDYQKTRNERLVEEQKEELESSQEWTAETGADEIVNEVEQTDDNTEMTETEEPVEEVEESTTPIPNDTVQETVQTTNPMDSIQFTENSKLLWPVDGNVIMSYNMDRSVYFQTLDQYKYNPAMIIAGAEGDQVICGAPGIVKSIDLTAQTGTTVSIDLGNGYELAYGQLREVPVKVGDYVEAKTILGYVNEPTKYYQREGSNVYFAMKKDGQPVNPLDYLVE